MPLGQPDQPLRRDGLVQQVKRRIDIRLHQRKGVLARIRAVRQVQVAQPGPLRGIDPLHRPAIGTKAEA